MRAVDEENREVRRSALIAAAARCLARAGVAKTSIADICKEAGMRSGHLYYYFPSKDALLEAVLLHRREDIVDAVEHMLDGGDLAARIVDVHVQAEEIRRSFGLTPTVRVELECYFSRLPREQLSAALSGVPMTNIIQQVTRRAIAASRLPADVDVAIFANAIAMIWQGMSLTRLWSDAAVDDMSKAARVLLDPWINSGAHRGPASG